MLNAKVRAEILLLSHLCAFALLRLCVQFFTNLSCDAKYSTREAFNVARQGDATTGEQTRRLRLWLFSVAVLGSMLVWGSGIAADSDASSHWAFRPVQRFPVPNVRHAEFVDSPVDAFIIEKLEAAGLEPVSEADKRTLLRRASFDLIGLPPSPAEVADFLTDQSPDAFATVVERLLASPHYGERWGRYWLDVARYANTQGDTGADPASPFAYTYRDYVIRAMNDDLPYDKFLIEQVAADRLEYGESSPALAALGFITVGRRFLGNIHDTIDDRIDVVTRGLMALTVNCARCHDHKYDPIPTMDYYGLYGVFASSNEPAQLPVIGIPDPVAHADYQRQRQEVEVNRANLIRQNEVEVLKRYRRQTADYLIASRKPEDVVVPEAARGSRTDGRLRKTGVQRWKATLEKLNPESDPVFAPWFAFAAIPDSEFAERAPELSAKIAGNSLPQPVNPIVAETFAGEPPTSLKSVAERYARLLDEVAKPQEPAVNESMPTDDPARQSLRQALVDGDAPGNLPEAAIREFFRQNVKSQIQKFDAERQQLDARHAGVTIRAMVLYDNPQPQNARIFIRGNANNPGDEAPRRFLEVLSGPNRQPFTQGSGRLELAKAIVGRENPLTARVIVNRVWLHHFGEGLVTTPDDFGLRSDAPSHPQLLDYLATRFMDEGWSAKKLHRLLMLSRVYRQASDDKLRSEAVDPANRMLSKMNRRRLDFESMRDTLLLVAGNLDQTIGGQAVELTPQPRVELGGAFAGPASDQPPSPRRAIYGFIDRQNLPGLLRVFDFADPDTCTGRRYVTTVPQQALFFFNNPFVMQQACSLAARAEFQSLDATDKRVQYLYQQIFQREPTAAELEMAIRYMSIEQSEVAATAENFTSAPDNLRSLHPWERFAHVLLMSDELMFVD